MQIKQNKIDRKSIIYIYIYGLLFKLLQFVEILFSLSYANLTFMHIIMIRILEGQERENA